MPLNVFQLAIDRASKCTLVGATLLLVYSLSIFAVTAHEGGFRGHHHHHGPRPENGRAEHPHFNDHAVIAIHHFAGLGVITALTGMVAAFTTRRGWALGFLMMVLFLEISLLGFISHHNAKAVQKCQMLAVQSERLPESVTYSRLEAHTKDGGKVVAEQLVVAESSKKLIVQPEVAMECTRNVRHAAVLASLMVGLIACTLACCTSRMMHAVQAEEEVARLGQVAAMHIVEAHAVVPAMAVLVSTDPNAPTKDAPAFV